MQHLDMSKIAQKAYEMRVLSLEATTQAGSGHPTSALSAADLVATLFFHSLQYNVHNPDDPRNDRFILSKGHAAPILYAAWCAMGVISREEVLTLRSFTSRLEGHPTPRFPYTEAATGSLGCGLSIGLGMALSTRLSGYAFYTYVLLGDSEMTEGSVWEAIEIAAFYKVHNLIALVDLNGLGQSTETIDDHHAEQHAQRWRAFGWNVHVINGHDIVEIVDALNIAKESTDKPTVIIAKTLKGYGLKSIENKQGYHGKAFSKEELPHLLTELKERFERERSAAAEEHTLKELFVVEMPELQLANESQSEINRMLSMANMKTQSELAAIPSIENVVSTSWPHTASAELTMPPAPYKKGQKIATRKAFGETLALLGELDLSIVSLDAEVKNSTFAEIFEKKFRDRFWQCFIAEQNMIGMGIGFAHRHFKPFCSTFACFLSRAHDQIRMAAIGRSPLRLVGSHAGVSIGQDGPSQMGLEDIALMRALPSSIIVYPSDAVSTYALMNSMVNYNEGISYLRLTRAETSVLYEADELFVLGGCKVLRESNEDQVSIIAAGITVHEALKAYEELKKRNISVCIIDLYSIKPIDTETIKRYVQKCHSRVITVEDHFIQGGLGEAVCYELRNEHCKINVLAVQELSRSGKPEELLAYHRIDHTAIVESVLSVIVD